MIRAVVFCPMAPVIVPALARGAAPELEQLRAACRFAIRAADAPDRRWIVLGPGLTSRTFDPTSSGTFAGFGLPLQIALGSSATVADPPTATRPDELPPSLTVGAWLLHDALGPVADVHGRSVDPMTDNPTTDNPATDGPAIGPFADQTSLLVMGEGSACRSLKAPGYLDERAVAFDEAIERALGAGDPAALATLDATLGAELLASGVPVWRAVAPELTGRVWDATVHHSSDPYGVAYVVASWHARD